MRVIQVAIPDKLMMELKCGVFVMQYLRGHGLNPEGNVTRFRNEKLCLTIYTERREDVEGPGEVGEMPAVEVGVRDPGGQDGNGGNKEALPLRGNIPLVGVGW